MVPVTGACALGDEGHVLDSVLVIKERSGHTPAQVSLKNSLMSHSLDTQSGFISQFSDFKVGL